MKEILNKIREPEKLTVSKKILYTVLILIAGIILGLISKILDTTASNSLPSFLEMLDLNNFFSRLAIWLFFGVVISIYSKSPFRAAINVFLFFVGMVASYYIYTVKVAGFFPKSYMMIWVVLTILSPIFAFVCWYAKGKGNIAIVISSIIFTVITSQAFVFGFWYLDISYMLEFIIWIATILVLYQSPKQIIKVVGLGTVLFFIASNRLFYG